MFRLKSMLICLLFTGIITAQNYHPSRIIVKLKNVESLAQQDGELKVTNEKWSVLNAKWKLKNIERLIKGKSKVAESGSPTSDKILLLSFDTAVNIPELIHQYKSLGVFQAVEPDYRGTGGGMKGITPNDEFYYNRQWSLYNDGTFNEMAENDADVDMEEGWDISTGEESTVIAILDSGFRLSHPEFSGRFWNSDDQAGDNQDDDNNGYIDDTLGWDFVNSDNDPTDDHGHGTNVASIMAATGNNTIGFAGINWKAKVMIGKILNSNNSGFYSDWISAIYYAVDNGAAVINMSVGGSGYSELMEEACDYAYNQDVVIAVSMMNTNSSTPFYPAAYASTIAVGATDANDERVDPFFWSTTSGSNYGNHHDLCAPGNFIYGLAYNSDSNYESYWGGTSQATPIVAGVASLIKGINPNFTVEEIREILRSTSDDQVGSAAEDLAGWDQYHGAGRLNAAAALEKANALVGTQEIAQNTDFFQLSPNPIIASTAIILEWKYSISEPVELTIYNSSGQLQYRESLVDLANRRTLKAPDTSGVYVLQIEDKDGKIHSQKFVVAGL